MYVFRKHKITRGVEEVRIVGILPKISKELLDYLIKAFNSEKLAAMKVSLNFFSFYSIGFEDESPETESFLSRVEGALELA